MLGAHILTVVTSFELILDESLDYYVMSLSFLLVSEFCFD